LGREHAGRAGEHVVMLSESRSEIALWGIPGAGRPGDPAGALEKLWSRPYETRPPVLLRLDPEAAYLYWPSVRGGSIERVDAITGETRWRTAHFTELFAADEAAQARLHEAIQRGERIETPLDGPVRPTDMLAVIDEQVVMLVERSGRAAAFDPASGRLLWTVRG